MIKNILLVALGAVLAFGYQYHQSHCQNLFCTKTSTATPSSGAMLSVKTQYSIPDVGTAPKLEKATGTLPTPSSIKLPLNVTSQNYIDHYSALANTGNELEVEVRKKLPAALYGVQVAAMSGDINKILDKIVAAKSEIQTTDALNKQFKGETDALAGDLNTSVKNQTVVAATQDLINKANALNENIDQFTKLASQVTQPKPPTTAAVEALNAMAKPLSGSFQGFALSLKATYNAVKSASQG